MGKIKNTEGSAMSVGLLVVRFLYSFYVCVQLPKWFTFFLVFSPLFLSGSLSFTLAPNGRNYMQLPTAVNFPVEPHRLCCGLHGLLSAPKRQLTYSFCYGQLFYFPFIIVSIFSSCPPIIVNFSGSG